MAIYFFTLVITVVYLGMQVDQNYWDKTSDYIVIAAMLIGGLLLMTNCLSEGKFPGMVVAACWVIIIGDIAKISIVCEVGLDTKGFYNFSRRELFPIIRIVWFLLLSCFALKKANCAVTA